MKALILIWVGLALSVMQAQAEELLFVQGDPAAGQQKSGVCAGCHGPDGNSANPQWPKLAGQHAVYLYQQLKAFKGNERQNALMSPQAAGLSDQDMQDLAAYYASLPRQIGSAGEGDLTLGTALYRGGNAERGIAACMACHGPAGTGNPAAGFPALTGQHAPYVAQQLRAYRSGDRKGGQFNMMWNVAAHLTDAEIEAVAHYINGLYRAKRDF